jgi:FMNH2-dependent dimethyl sulfone monooxygenase
MENLADIANAFTNPLFGPNKLKLGVFFGNVGGGARPTTAPGRLEPRWGDILSMATIADRAGFEALVPLAVWTGIGGESHFLENSFETTAWASGLAQATRSIGILSTTQIATYHPVMAAKLATTIDHISGGRFAMNIVCGANRNDLDLFGAPLLEHDAWYDYATEWLEIVKRLWSEDVRFDFSGKYFQLKGAVAKPKPIQKPFPALMNAGASPVGQRWAAQNADMAFTAVTAGDFEAAKSRVEDVRALAAEAGRSIQVWIAASVVVRDSQQEADDYVDFFSLERGDMESATKLAAGMGMTPATGPLSPEMARLESRRLVGSSFYQQPLWGTPRGIAEQLQWLSSARVDGVLMTFVNYHDELRRLVTQVMPLLEEAGLRHPVL